MTYSGHMKAGAVVLDEAVDLPEGVRVRCVLIPETQDTPAQDPTRPCHAGLLKFSGVIKDLPPDAAQNIDHYLYGSPRK